MIFLPLKKLKNKFGKTDKEKISQTLSENAKETNYNFFTNSFISQNSNISESINTYHQQEFIYDTHFFTQELETFSCLSFLSDGFNIISPQKLKLLPYFKNTN